MHFLLLTKLLKILPLSLSPAHYVYSVAVIIVSISLVPAFLGPLLC